MKVVTFTMLYSAWVEDEDVEDPRRLQEALLTAMREGNTVLEDGPVVEMVEEWPVEEGSDV